MYPQAGKDGMKIFKLRQRQTSGVHYASKALITSNCHGRIRGDMMLSDSRTCFIHDAQSLNNIHGSGQGGLL
jgi:hypothetical protein